MSTATEHPSAADARDTSARSRADVFGYVFPAVRGIQAQRYFYVTMVPLRLIPRLFLFDEEELQPSLRAQRTLNKTRIPEIARYVLDNRNDYVFSALTASVDADIHFEPYANGNLETDIGQLSIPMSARFVINDGQHRRAAIEMALRENPDLGDESIPIVLFLDIGLERCQQMFTDLNRYAVRPSRSLTILYDHRQHLARVVKSLVKSSALWTDLIEMERGNLSARSRKLFTLSSLHSATKALLDTVDELAVEEATKLARTFWDAVAQSISEWRLVHEKKVTAGDVRRDFVHSHGVALHALGRVGNALLRESRDARKWRRSLVGLTDIEWSRSNVELWEGRALARGKLNNSTTSVILTSNAIKNHLGLEMSPEELRIETMYERGQE